jgi:protein-S-isoprenylcysteine O-methyltransferase Ste14
VRHSSYLGLALILFALALQARTWASFTIALVPLTLAVVHRIQVEETVLRLALAAITKTIAKPQSV